MIIKTWYKMAGETPNKRLLYSERAPGRMYDMYEHPAIVDLFADGQGRILTGPQLTKIEYYRTVEITQKQKDKWRCAKSFCGS
jgi:hypothetical protein